jgi:hypothetical protein
MVVNQPAKVGELRIAECRDEELHRYVRAAKLFAEDSTRYSVTLPELLDVRLISMSPQAFTLAGFERIDGAEYAQSWLVVYPASYISVPPRDVTRYGNRESGDRS